MNTGQQQPTDTYLDFIIRYYGDPKYLPYYINLTGVDYNEFVTGITMTRDLPEIILEEEPIFNNIFEEEIEYIDVYKNERQTLLDTTLQYYSDPSRVIDNLIDSKLTDYYSYRDILLYKKIDINKNKNSEYYKQNSIKVETGGKMIELMVDGEYDTHGDFADDYNNDFTI